MSVKQLLSAEPLYLIDGSAFVFRGFYANQTLARSDGFPTGALLIVARTLLRILREEQPKRMVMVLDGKGPTFRHDLFPPYKSQRKTVPEGLILQLDPIKRLTRALGIPLVVSEQCEADDCIASLASREPENSAVVIVGADKDLKQCLRKNVLMWDPAGKDGKITTLDSFTEETGLDPCRWPDVQAVIGDSSDNIPGVPGIGIKTAEKLFTEFKSLEDIRDRYDTLSPALKKKFDGHMDAVFLYRKLTTMQTDRCTDIDTKATLLKSPDIQEVIGILREFELHSVGKEAASVLGALISAAAPSDSGRISVQGSFFDSPFPPPSRTRSIIYTDDPDEFIKSADITVAVISESGSLHLASRENEYAYTGSMSALAGALARACASNRITRIVTADLKKLVRELPELRSIPAPRWFDLAIASYLLSPEQADYGWPRLAGHWSVVLNLDPSFPAILALAISKSLSAQIEDSGLNTLMRTLEMPLAPILAEMEERGILLDKQRLEDFLAGVTSDLEILTKNIYSAAGTEFNIRSARQLGEILFKRLNLPVSGKTQGGQASTSKDVLDNLSGKHPVIDTLLRYRILDKLRSTYLEPLPRLTDEDGRIRTTFNQTATATGRLSSSNPNLQNIPVRGEEGKKMRLCFTAPQGNLLISADYSQIELRVLAHISQDPELTAAFRAKADIHTRTAALLYGVAAEEVTKAQRGSAKTINFGLIYGMGAQKLARELGITLTEAREFIHRYFEHLTVLKEFYEQVKETARSQGYVTTLAGRRRLLPGINSAAVQLRALAERQAVNTVIQGSAADIIKIAMIAAARDPILRELDAKMLLQIHDELIFEVPEAHADSAGKRIAEIMSNAAPAGIPLSVPLIAEWGMGKNWGDAH